MERSVSSVELNDSLNKTIGFRESLVQIVHDRSARPAMALGACLGSVGRREMQYLPITNSSSSSNNASPPPPFSAHVGGVCAARVDVHEVVQQFGFGCVGIL